jgi:serine/threonine protein kinase
MEEAQPLKAPDGRVYHRLQQLGSGGQGDVYLARRETPGGLHKNVAIKMLRAGDATPEARRRLEDEANVLGQLDHGVIVRIDDVLDLPEGLGVVMEFVDGDDFGRLLHRARLPLRAGLETVRDVAAALEYAWSHGHVVHRDIKPQNIRIHRNGNVKLLDFGIARTGLFQRTTQTEHGLVVGTVTYMAPERFSTKNSLDENRGADVYALGCILWEVCAVHTGLGASSLLGQLEKAQHYGVVLNPRKHDAWVEEQIGLLMVPQLLRGLLLDMLAHDAAVRPTYDVIVRDLTEAASALPLGDALSVWARTHTWPESPKAPGRWVRKPGQTTSPTAARTSPSGTLLVAGLVGVPLLATVLAIVAVVLGGVAVAAAVAWNWSSAQPENTVAVARPPEPATRIPEPLVVPGPPEPSPSPPTSPGPVPGPTDGLPPAPVPPPANPRPAPGPRIVVRGPVPPVVEVPPTPSPDPAPAVDPGVSTPAVPASVCLRVGATGMRVQVNGTSTVRPGGTACGPAGPWRIVAWTYVEGEGDAPPASARSREVVVEPTDTRLTCSAKDQFCQVCGSEGCH